MSRVLTVLGNVRYFHLMKVSNMVQMVTMVAPLYSVEHHIDSIRIDWIELVWSYFAESLLYSGVLLVWVVFLYYAKDF
jgi:hypothetical protein